MLGRLAVCLLLALPAAAHAAEFAPLDRPGPPLTAKAKLTCSPNVAGAARAPVLLNPATGVTVDENYDWNWVRALDARGIPWCKYDAPAHTLGDIQTSGELLADAIRTVAGKAGRPIAVMGHSQGGMSMRWALRFWPDTRTLVDDVIGFAGSNHGTTAMRGLDSACAQLGCMPASLQQGAGSAFIKAVNSGKETFAGVSYTNIYTRYDEVVTPPSSSELHTGDGAITNVTTQDLCPAELNEHLTVGTISPAAYALAIDALDHPGPASLARADRSVCARPFMPGVDPANAGMYVKILSGAPGLASVPLPGVALVDEPDLVRAEPPLRCYVLAAGCPAGTTPTATSAPSTARRTCSSRRRFTIRVPRGARVKVAGKRVRVRKGRATVDLRGRRAETVAVRISAGDRSLTRRYRTCVKRR
jgi:hypothetical protein